VSLYNPDDLRVVDTEDGGVDIVFHLTQGKLDRIDFVKLVQLYAGMIQEGINATRSYASQVLAGKKDADESA
jgi:hypothetical protein